MHKKRKKYIVPIVVISLVIFLSLFFLIINIFKSNEYITDNIDFSVEDEELLATTEINESSANAGNFTASIKGSTVWPIVEVYIYTDSSLTKTTGKTIPALTECMVTDVFNYAFKVKYITNGKGWQDSDATFTEAWGNARRLLINLPDVCPEIEYNITNAYSSIFKIGSSSRGAVVNINGLTGEQLYTYDNYDGTVDGKIYNSKLGKKEFVCPLIYPFAEEVAAAQKNALKHGYGLKIYDAYRPQEDVCKKFWSLTQNAMNSSTAAYNLINKNGWSLGWFVANPNNGGSSEHARGTAIDVTLVKDGKEIAIPSDMHDLSTNAVKVSSPTTIYDVTPQINYTEDTKLLHEIMVNESGMGGLPSEWWHFNTAKKNTEFKSYVGKFNITYTDKTQLKITNTQYSTKEATNQNVTVTITASKDIKTAKGSKSGNWTINGKTAKKVYTGNSQQDLITLTDNAGNTVTTTINVTNIDKTAPSLGTPEYSTKSVTNENVTVTISSNETIAEIVGNGWSYTDNNHTKIKKTYSSNVKNEKVQVKDAVGNTSKEATITVSNIDKTAPKLEKILYDYDTSKTYVFAIISVDEEISVDEVIDWGKATTPTNLSDDEAKKYGVDKDKSLKLWYLRENSNNTENTELSDKIRLSDTAGNELQGGVSVKLDIFPPKLDVEYNPPTNQYTNETVEVTITATDEDIEKYEAKTDGWQKLSNRKLTKTFTENSKETIIVYDKNGNKNEQSINVNKIDKKEPYIINQTVEEGSDDSKILIVTFSEPVKTDSSEWKNGSTENILYKTYTSEKNETVIVSDKAGNTYNFDVKATQNTNGKLEVKIYDNEPPVLENIIYGTTSPTNENVNVTIVVNEEINKPEGWNLSEGTDELEGKWVLTKNYKNNVQDDVIEITDTSDNKIIGKNVTDGKVHININNIDRIAPTVTEATFINKENGKVVVKITLNEAIQAPGYDWEREVPNPAMNGIIKTLDENTKETFEVKDIAGNIATVQVDVANKKVVDLPIIEQIKNNKKTSNTNVPVKIVVNKKIKEIAGWNLSEGTDELDGKWILSRTYTENANENVLIEDEDGNKGVSEEITNGLVPIKITIDNDEILIDNIETNESTGQIRVKFNKEIVNIGNNPNWEVDRLTGEITNTKKFTESITETIIVKDAALNTAQIKLKIQYNAETGKYTVTEEGKENKNLTGIQIESLPNKTIYFQGEKLNTDGLTIKLIYNYDEENTEVIEEGFEITSTSKTFYTQSRKRNCICRI